MNIRRVVPNVTTKDLKKSRDFYTELLGLKVAMDMGFIVTLVSESNETAQISFVRGDEGSPSHPYITVSIEVEDVVEIHKRAVTRGLKILYPLTDEPYGVRRFHVADPNGTVLNILSHIDKKK